MDITRLLPLESVFKQKSCFLFGPRQTGKTTLIEKLYPKAPLIQLLDPNTQRALLANPSLLAAMIPAHEKTVVIDEIQKTPELLDR